MGLFINTLPLRVRIAPERSLISWLKTLRRQWIDMRAYEHTALAMIQRWSQIPAPQPLFESLLVFENSSLNGALQAQGGPWRHRTFDLRGTTNYPLSITGYLEPALLLEISYDGRRFDAGTIQRLGDHLQTILEGMAAQPQARLGDLPLLTAAERQQLLVTWNDTRTEYPADQCLAALFEAQVAQTPDAVAVVCGDQRLTYRELNRHANQLAHYLQQRRVGPEVLVGVCIERSLELVIALVGILKAGGAYVPLDPTYPKERLAFILEDAQVPVLLTQERLVSGLPPHGAHVVCLDTGWATIAQERGENPVRGTTPRTSLT